MRIGLVTPSWPASVAANGIATAVAHIADGLKHHGHQITVIPHTGAAPDDPDVINLPEPRAWTWSEKLIGRFGRNTASIPIRAEQIAQAVNQAIKTRGIEALIMEETNGIAGMVQKHVPIPVIVTLHGPIELYTDFLPEKPDGYVIRTRVKREAETCRTCRGITSPSKAVLDQMIARYGEPACPTAIVPNQMPMAAPIPEKAIRETIRNILFFGRYDSIKGGDTVLEAFQQIAEQDPNVRLTFVGSDPGVPLPGQVLQHMDQALLAYPEAIRNRIDYRGQLDRDAIDTLRMQHGITLIASRYENFPYAALEALSCGAPTVATAVGGVPEIVEDEISGLLVPSGDPEAMAKACLRLIADPDLAVRLGAKGRTEVVDRFQPETIAKDVEALVQQVLNKA
jgi:glycosyltransferase involved in cell wall biosynthesis